MRYHVGLAIAVVLLSGTPVAAVDDYLCEIMGTGRVVASGQFEETNILKMYVGRKFSVDRKTGMMSGALKNNYHSMPRLVDRGSKDNSFKVMTVDVFENTTNVYVLNIGEFEEGPNKPFIFYENSSVYYGRCRHF
ncbi:hypothetical protein [Kordiimonas sp.]|uniref:hypothetical protein n=1 Tax=Kordiimonas sp. TaxID=1970157 RepID=UPI003A943333